MRAISSARITVCALVLLSQGAAADSIMKASIESTVTWMTGAQPEVHLLIENKTDRSIEFSSRLGRGKGGGTSCAGNLDAVDPRFNERFDRRLGISRIMTTGTIPARGWAHRSYPVGESGLVPPCDVPYAISVDGAELSGVVHVAFERPTWEGAEVTARSLVVAHAVEENRYAPPGVIVRSLVRNQERTPIYILMSRRDIECAPGHAGRFSLHETVLQGEDVGPAVVPPSGWLVFVNDVALDRSEDAKMCSIRVELSALTKQGMRRVVESEISLAPSGAFGVPLVRTR
jgi:hypothetical protein